MNMATHTSLTDEQKTEDAIVKAGKTAPRITPADIDQTIVDEFYFTAAEGIESTTGIPRTAVDLPSAVKTLTFCVLVLRNGFTVTGESACASPENFDPQIGRDIAFKNAREKIWLLKATCSSRSCTHPPVRSPTTATPSPSRPVTSTSKITVRWSFGK